MGKFQQLINDQKASINQVPKKRPLEISGIEDDLIRVNDKEVRKDMNGHWIASEELTRLEYLFFREYLGIRSRVPAKDLKATYRF